MFFSTALVPLLIYVYPSVFPSYIFNPSPSLCDSTFNLGLVPRGQFGLLEVVPRTLPLDRVRIPKSDAPEVLVVIAFVFEPGLFNFTLNDLLPLTEASIISILRSVCETLMAFQFTEDCLECLLGLGAKAFVLHLDRGSSEIAP